MHPKWLRYRRWCLMLAGGGVTLGFLSGLQMVDWASFFATFLATWLSTLVSLFLGGGFNLGTTT